MTSTTYDKNNSAAALQPQATGQTKRPDDRRVRFWDRIAKKYARRPIANEAAYRKKLEITRDYFRPDMNVLEFGCGTGSTAIAHAPFVNQIRATDISSNMIEIARGKAAAENIENVTFEQSTIDALDVPARSVDAVMGHSILHLLEDRDAAITKVHDMLKPGGVFISSTACLAGSMGWFKPIAAIGRVLGLLPLVRFFTAAELQNSLVRAGFDIDHLWQPDKGQSVFIVARKAV
jgi:ubiquinone/menaquinone biosynthesis C-methylase UbiE